VQKQIFNTSVKSILAVVGICSITFLLCGAFGPGVLPEVRTRRLAIVDEAGREVGFLAGSNGQGRLELRNLANRTSATIAAEAEASIMLGTSGKDRVRLFNKGELSALEIRGDQGKVRILVGLSDKGKPKVILRGADEQAIWQAPPEDENEDKL
jgi:hypothetical protein